jgi:hypothetical protein
MPTQYEKSDINEANPAIGKAHAIVSFSFIVSQQWINLSSVFQMLPIATTVLPRLSRLTFSHHYFQLQYVCRYVIAFKSFRHMPS